MCNLGEGIAERAMAEGEARGEVIGMEKERLVALKRIIKNMKLTAEQAMNALEIPMSERKRYTSLLESGN